MSTRKEHDTVVSHVDDAAEVGRRLRGARLNAGLTQRALAFPGCSTGYISRIEAGQRVPSLPVLRELARRLGTTEEFLAYGRDGTRQTDRLVEAEVALRMEDHELAERLYRAEYDSEDPARRAAAAKGLGQLAYRQGNL